MKKIFIVTLFLCILLLTGCSNEKYFTCKIDLYNEISKYEFNAVYKVYYKNSFVTKIEKDETYISEEKETLDYFNEYKKLEYDYLNNTYGKIIYNIDLRQNRLVLSAIIDMNLIDIEKMVKDKYIDRDYIISNKLTTGGVKNIYKEKGATCDI